MAQISDYDEDLIQERTLHMAEERQKTRLMELYYDCANIIDNPKANDINGQWYTFAKLQTTLNQFFRDQLNKSL